MFRLFVLLFSLNVVNNADLPSTRIIGGKDASKNQFPYIASLRFLNKHICGASIISEKYVLSAANCEVLNWLIFGASVHVGTVYKNETGITYKIKQVIKHPNYLWPRLDYNIALIQVFPNIFFDQAVQPIELYKEKVPENIEAVVIGWGWTTDSLWQQKKNKLQYLNETTQNIEKCGWFKDKFINWETEKQSKICSKTVPGKGICLLDSGGPLIYNNKIIGVVSYVPILCGKHSVEVYTNVSYFSEWIQYAIARN